MHKLCHTHSLDTNIVIPNSQHVLAPFSDQETQRKFGVSRGVMVKAQDSEIVVSEFELQSRYYVPFQTNRLILPAMD